MHYESGSEGEKNKKTEYAVGDHDGGRAESDARGED